jgi:spermidine synthase
MFAVITRTFTTIFPDAQILLLRFNVDVPVVGLVGTYSRFNYGPDWLERRVTRPELQEELKRLALTDSLRLFGHFVGRASVLVPINGSEPLNTDDDPVVSFRAPRFVYEKDVTSYGRLTNLIALAAAVPPTERVLGNSSMFQQQLQTYIAARDIFLRGLMREREGEREQAVEDYIESARISAEFTSGYAQCLSIASVLARSEPQKAKAILLKLVEAQPTRPVAREMLRRLE